MKPTSALAGFILEMCSMEIDWFSAEFTTLIHLPADLQTGCHRAKAHQLAESSELLRDVSCVQWIGMELFDLYRKHNDNEVPLRVGETLFFYRIHQSNRVFLPNAHSPLSWLDERFEYS